MSTYYLKKLGTQELGVSPDGTIARGRYIYITKAYDNFFPDLSKIVKNDNVLLPIVPPFSDKKIYTTLVYHNDKFSTTGGTRDEFRLYLNKDIDPDRSYFKPEDIVVFQREEGEQRQIPDYILQRFSPEDPIYPKLAELVSSSSIRGGHALIFDENEIDFIPKRNVDLSAVEVIIPSEVMSEVVIQQTEVLEGEENGIEETRGASLFGSESFRDFVMMAYEYKCAITRKSISYKKLNNLETAHIQPKAQSGTYLPCNGIALSRDMHWAFDKGFFTISDDFKIIVHDEVKSTILGEYDNKPLFIPHEQYFQPEKKYLKHHREKIFGLFLYSGSIRSDS
jgi:hypothetical protein